MTPRNRLPIPVPYLLLGVAGVLGLGAIRRAVSKGGPGARPKLRRLKPKDWEGKVVLITGGARGLGKELAMQYAARGAHLALCSRSAADLAIARDEISRVSPHPVEIYVCDVGERRSVERMVRVLRNRLGRIDLLVNCASQIQVAPLHALDSSDYEQAIKSNLLGMIYVSNACLPCLEETRGRILNITSLGGLAPVPHLAPYTTSKFGAVGYSGALAIEARPRGVAVTTAAPSLMRTGSFIHALFKGDRAAEFRWFSGFASSRLFALSARKAASRMIAACDRGRPFVTVGLPARLAQLAYGLTPNLYTRAAAAGTALILPKDVDEPDSEALPGWRLEGVDRRPSRAGRDAQALQRGTA